MSTTAKQLPRFRTTLLWLAAVRGLLGIIAIPLAPFLYREHFVLLVLLRPTKEVLLAGGFLIRQHDVNPLAVVVAALPLAVLGVWLFYYLGRSFEDEIRSGDRLPRLAERVLPPKRIKMLCRLLDRKGQRVIFVGRLASFPSTLLGAAAGASAMGSRKFLPADLAGAVVGIAEVLLAGYVLGHAYREAGAWLAAVGVVLLVALLVGIGRALARDPDDQRSGR